MGAKVIVHPAQGDSFEVPIGNTATIGRTKDNTVCLSASPLVSRQHAVIRCHNGYQYQIIDLGSRNGTFVNDQRVVVPVTLTDDARIRIADNILQFCEDLAENTQDLTMTQAGSGIHHDIISRPVALLVCDIRGFSAMAEHTQPNDVAQILGAWFRETSNLVLETNGTIDKFIGDAMLAYWGASHNAALDCVAALEAGRKMLARAAAHRWPSGEPFRVSVALHFGLVTCTNMGIDASGRDATIIGDAVNTVFRLEALSKQIDRSLVMSHDFAGNLTLTGNFEDHGEQSLKGKTQPVRVYSLAVES
jgi:adenylate cyclase